jgi:energy-coupling factor transporter transmembrane protein EcfT
MIQEPFASGHSPIHRTNPALRVVAATLFSFTAAVLDNPGALSAALGAGVLLAGMAALPLGPLMKRLGAAAGLLLLVWLVVPLTLWRRSCSTPGAVPGEPSGTAALPQGHPQGRLHPAGLHRPGGHHGHRHSGPQPTQARHAQETGPAVAAGVPVHLRHRTGIWASVPRRPHAQFRSRHQPAHLSHLCLSRRHAVCTSVGTGRPGAPRHEVPGLRRKVSLPGRLCPPPRGTAVWRPG